MNTETTSSTFVQNLVSNDAEVKSLISAKLGLHRQNLQAELAKVQAELSALEQVEAPATTPLPAKKSSKGKKATKTTGKKRGRPAGGSKNKTSHPTAVVDVVKSNPNSAFGAILENLGKSGHQISKSVLMTTIAKLVEKNTLARSGVARSYLYSAN